MISSPPEWSSYKEAPISGSWLKRMLKSWFRYVDYPFLLGYRGFGNSRSVVVQGHVFRGMALRRPRKRHSAWKNFIALIKMFLVRTVEGACVKMTIGEQIYEIRSGLDGFFEFEIPNPGLEDGWHEVELELQDKLVEGQERVWLTSEVLIMENFEHGLISDIDDTFLVSHVTKIWRKLYLLLTKNAETRKPFRGVVDFYQRIGEGSDDRTNPFFYVSSSEWNLYDFLINFTRFHKLPKGVLQLRNIKDSIWDFMKAGSHGHKQVKIERILAMYPGQPFILLGDNGQHDPYIYFNIARKYPGRIKAIYIRAVKKRHHKKVNEVLQKIDALSIPSLQFRRSREAVEHARKHGLIE